MNNPCENCRQSCDIPCWKVDHGLLVEPPRWNPASEPPKEYRDKYGELIPFLVCENSTEYPFRAMYDGKCWGDGIYAVPVKWWMPLPEAPKEDEP